ncbi:MAG: DUF2252 domain-containing protein, partial [Acidobacteriia bacterium]|nr:DUF2252 domain-containing protein [Terriglobia bacterium]
WLRKRTPIAAADLKLKHQRMAESPFPFLRATFYRWAQLWPEVCPDLARAPHVLAVCDHHVENFGTWRDIEGRLIWGVNDFDEAYPMPYTIDQVRLAASAHVAVAENHLAIPPGDACQAILEGYTQGLTKSGNPFVLEQHHGWLRDAALGELRDPVQFWEKMESLSTIRGPIPRSATKALEALLPEKGLAYRVAHRIAGLGSLGRERFVALADWRGGHVAREAKALVPSACVWADGNRGSKRIFYEDAISRAVRVPDPFVHLRGRWIVRRLAPHCSRIELSSLPKTRDEWRLLHAMGFETANVHWGSRKAIPAVVRDLKKRPSDWFHAAVQEMLKATTKDWEEWRRL